MRFGFTGSRYGMTPEQRTAVRETLLYQKDTITETHYGDCEGADKELLLLMMELNLGGQFHAHPATMNPGWDRMWRAHTANLFPELHIIEHDPLPPMDRNIVIVQAVDLLCGTPATPIPVQRSGTWATIRHAREYAKTVQGYEVLVWGPDGEEL